MGLAQDLLQQADHLAAYERANPTQASLRRAVSTACYAPFHLLIEDAASRWSGSVEAQTGLQRAFQHGATKKASNQFRTQTWHNWQDKQQAIPLDIRKVAAAAGHLAEIMKLTPLHVAARQMLRRRFGRGLPMSLTPDDPSREDAEKLLRKVPGL